jgi:methyl-accepting chemotaxis protein
MDHLKYHAPHHVTTKFSIRKKMIVYILIPIVLLLVLATFFLYQNSRKVAYEQAQAVSENQALISALTLTDTLSSYTQEVENLQAALKSIEKLPLADKEDLIANELLSTIKDNESALAVWSYWNRGAVSHNSSGFSLAYVREDNAIKKTTLAGGNFSYDLTSNDSGQPHMMEPYMLVDVMVLSYTVPILDQQGRVLGVVGINYSLANLQTYIEEQKVMESGFMRILSNTGVVVAHKSFSRVGKFSGELDENGQGVYIDIIQNGKIYTSIEYSAAINQNTYKSLAPLKFGGTLWSVGTILTEDEVLKEANQRTMWTMIIAAFFIVIIGGLIFIVAVGLSKPLIKISDLAYELSDLNITSTVDVNLLKRKDEVGVLAIAFDKILKNLSDFMASNTKIAKQLNDFSKNLSEVSQESSSVADEISSTIDEVSNGANEQAEEAEVAVQLMNDFGRLIEEEQVQLVTLNSATDRVIVNKIEGIKTIGVLVDKTKLNEQSAHEISEVIENANASALKIAAASSMIKNISDQTNLLALNAAIEAARAGEAGRGFSVVAEEIRKLAEQSDQFTEEIALIIKDLKEKTENAVRTMDQMKHAVEEQGKSVDDVQHKFDDIAKAIEMSKQTIDHLNVSGEQMKLKKDQIISNIEGLAAITEEFAASTQEINASVEEQTAGINQISDASIALTELASEMEANLSKFKF